MKENFKKQIKNIDWLFFGILILLSISPIFVKINRTFLINQLDDIGDYDLAVSWGYLYLIFEAINVFVIVPIYSFTKKNVNNKLEVKERTLIAYMFVFASFLFMLIFVALLSISISERFAKWNGVSFSYVYKYLLIFGFSLSINLLISGFISYIILNKKKIKSFILILFNLFFTILIDYIILHLLPNANLINVGISASISSLIIFFVVLSIVYFSEMNEWNYVIKNFSFKKWKGEYKLYIGSSLWLGFETLFWNFFYLLGVTIWLSYGVNGDSNHWESAFWTMDGLFWGGLLLPSLAVNLFIAERIPNLKTLQEKRQIVNIGWMLNFLILISWFIFAPLIIEVLFPIILSDPEVLKLSRKLSWMSLGFFVFQLFTRTIYTYFAVIGKGKKIFLGTIIGGSIVWLTSFVIYLSNIKMNNPIWISFIYGLGILGIFISYYIIWLDEVKIINFKFKKKKSIT